MPIDLENLKMKLESARKDYQTIGIEEETWLQNFELSRDRVLSSLLHCQETNRQSIEETRSLFDFIITECAITDIKKPYTVMCEAIFAYDQRVQNCEASLYKLGMGLSASPMAPAHTNFAQDRSHLVETTETATNFSKTNALVPEPTSALPPAAEKSNQSEVPLRLTPDETNVASPAASTLMELYSMLEDEIADCEARLHDVQPFFQFTDGSQARHHPVKLATQADAGTAALQEGFDRLHWLPGPELRGCPLNTLLSEESLVLQCLDSHCKIEPGPRRKRKPGSVSSIAGAGLPSTTCSSHDIRLNTFAFTGVTPLYPQLVSAAVEHQSRNLGFKFGTGVNSVNNSTPGSNLTSLETMKRNDDEALQTFAILASILQLEAQTREAAISVAKWQQLAADATRMAAKVMSSLDSIFVDSDHDDDKPQLHRATGEVGGSTDDDNGRCSGQRVASQKSSPTPYRSRARSGSIDATSSLPLSLPSNQATASPGYEHTHSFIKHCLYYILYLCDREATGERQRSSGQQVITHS